MWRRLSVSATIGSGWLEALPATGGTAHFLHRLTSLSSNQKQLGLAVLLAAVSLVACIDHWTGDDAPLRVLYLPVIMAACWTISLSCAVTLSLVCSSLWLIDDFVYLGTHAGMSGKYWNSAVHLTYFLVVTAVTARLREAYRREQQFARTDPLTGLCNSGAFKELAVAAAERCSAEGQPLSIGFFDCDNFKQVNDTQGHLAGDHLLRTIAQACRESVRDEDVVGRLGGDEFAVLLPFACRDDAETVIRRMHRELIEKMNDHDWPVTFSIGVAVFEHPPLASDTLIQLADELMYSVKRSSKNGILLKVVQQNGPDQEGHQPEIEVGSAVAECASTG